MARKKAKALPPKMITVYAEILQETEDGLLVRCNEDADGVWLPKSQINYDGMRGDTGVEIEIPDWLADEKGFFNGMGRPEVEVSPASAEPEQPETVTFYGSFNEEDQDGNGVVFTVEYDDASINFTIPRDQIIEIDHNDPETENCCTITVSRAYAIEVDWTCHVYYSVMPEGTRKPSAREEEQIEEVSLVNLLRLAPQMISNLPWLILAAINHIHHGGEKFWRDVKYGSSPLTAPVSGRGQN